MVGGGGVGLDGGGIVRYRCLNKQDVNSLRHGPRRKQVIRCVVAGSTFELPHGIKGTVRHPPSSTGVAALPPSSFPSLADCVPFAQTA